MELSQSALTENLINTIYTFKIIKTLISDNYFNCLNISDPAILGHMQNVYTVYAQKKNEQDLGRGEGMVIFLLN